MISNAVSQSTIEMDKLLLRHAYGTRMYKELEAAICNWRQAVDHIRDDNDLVCWWYFIRLKKPPAWERVNHCRKEYEAIEARWKEETKECHGQYWNER